MHKTETSHFQNQYQNHNNNKKYIIYDLLWTIGSLRGACGWTEALSMSDKHLILIKDEDFDGL